MSIDPPKLATAKLSLVRDTALDGKLNKLALRLIGIFVGIHMRPEHDGVAWPSTKFICKQLGVSSESKVRSALYALLERGYLVAERKAGETTRYRIADRYFDGGAPPPIGATPQPLYGAGSDDTPPPIGATPQPLYGAGSDDTPPPIRATPQPLYGAGRAPPIGATNTVNRKPLREDRKSPPLSPNGSGAASLWLSDEVEVLSFGATPKAFECFQALWKWRQGESVKAARAAFYQLSEADREGAIGGARSFQEAMADRRFRPHALAYLAERQWTFSPPAPPATMATSRNGVGMLLAESYGFGREHRPEKTIDLGAARVGDGAPCKSMAQRLPDGNFRLHPASDQLQAWRDFERREFGRARPGLVRRSEWPAESSAAAMQAGTAERRT